MELNLFSEALTSIASVVMTYLMSRCRNELAASKDEIRKLTALLTVPVNAMFEDVKAGKIALTQEGEQVRSILGNGESDLIRHG